MTPPEPAASVGDAKAIRVTVTAILNEDLWGATDAFANGGEGAVVELIMEDIGAFFEEAKIHAELIDPAVISMPVEVETWNSAIEECILRLPWRELVRPQEIADTLRSLMLRIVSEDELLAALTKEYQATP